MSRETGITALCFALALPMAAQVWERSPDIWELAVTSGLAVAQTPDPTDAPASPTVPVHITSNPESISSLYPVLHTRKIGLHTVRMCNLGAVPVALPPEQVFMALAGLPSMTVERAEALVADSYDHNRKLTIVRFVEYGAILATVVISGGMVAAVPKVSSALGASIPVAHLLGDKIKGEVPALSDILSNVLAAQVNLAAAGADGYCATRTIFTPAIKQVKSYEVTVAIPVAQR
jgi:hypothetical protein